MCSNCTSILVYIEAALDVSFKAHTTHTHTHISASLHVEHTPNEIIPTQHSACHPLGAIG